MPYFFLLFAITLAVSAVIGILARSLKQPLILAYIVTGILISLTGILKGVDTSVISLISNVGIAFLLFLVGIELNLEDLKYVGKVAIFGGTGQILFTTLVGFVLISALGFSTLAAFCMAIAITFSSTVIIIKLLAEKNDLQSLHGKIIIGLLLVQDFVAVLVLMLLAAFSKGNSPSFFSILAILLRGILLVVLTSVFTTVVLKPLLKKASESVELLFVSAIAWAFLMAALAESIGFSVAIGAFMAGVAIASSPYRSQISGRIKPLRDFFLVIFFILLGVSMPMGTIVHSLGIIAILSLFVLIGKALIVLAIMVTLKFRNRTSVLTSLSMVQISEFSLILMTVSAGLGFVGKNEVAIIGAVGVVTITVSSYLILYGDVIYKRVERIFSRVLPQRHHDPYVVNRENLKDHVILVGGEQMGSDILDFLKTKTSDKKQIVVVDFNPEIYKQLQSAGYNAVFGDITDPEVLEELELGKAKLIIMTDPDIHDSSHLIAIAREKNFKGPIISASYWIHDAIKLYENGADYVVVPETVGGKHVSRVLAEHWQDLSKIKKEKSKHFEELVSHKIF